ncbi:hypothetical protein PG990_013660 [Apiospora arundinis]
MEGVNLTVFTSGGKMIRSEVFTDGASVRAQYVIDESFRVAVRQADSQIGQVQQLAEAEVPDAGDTDPDIALAKEVE